jgi:hypothetical protein
MRAGVSSLRARVSTLRAGAAESLVAKRFDGVRLRGSRRGVDETSEFSQNSDV